MVCRSRGVLQEVRRVGKRDRDFVVDLFKYVRVGYHGFQPDSKGVFMSTNVFEQRGGGREVPVWIYKSVAQCMPSLDSIQKLCRIRAGVRIPDVYVSNILNHIKELPRIEMTCNVDVCRGLSEFRHRVLVEVRGLNDLGQVNLFLWSKVKFTARRTVKRANVPG